MGVSGDRNDIDYEFRLLLSTPIHPFLPPPSPLPFTSTSIHFPPLPPFHSFSFPHYIPLSPPPPPSFTHLIPQKPFTHPITLVEVFDESDYLHQTQSNDSRVGVATTSQTVCKARSYRHNVLEGGGGRGGKGVVRRWVKDG